MAIYILKDSGSTPESFMVDFPFRIYTESTLPQMAENDLIIGWDWSLNDDELREGWLLNSSQSIENCMDPIWQDLLLAQNIPIATSKQVFHKKYLIYIFNLDCIGIYVDQSVAWLSKISNRKYTEVSLKNNSLEIRNLKKLAIRVIHSLGLDFGMVTIGVANKKQFVIKPSPIPILNKKMMVRFGYSILNLEKELLQGHSPEGLLLGADPEFVLKHKNGKFLLASYFFSKEGDVGCDQIWLHKDPTKKKLPLVELRPKPSSDPILLSMNIYHNLLKASEKIRNSNIQFLAGSTPLRKYPIGGHIHFSRVTLNSFFLHTLDNYLALPIFLLEDRRGFNRRPKYGFLGDFRMQFHGGFEYRTLPSWIISPRITKGVLSLAKVVASHYPQLRNRPLQTPELQMAYYRGEQEPFKKHVQQLWNELEALPVYKEYKEELDALKEDICNEVQWNELNDIRPLWQLPPYDRNGSSLTSL